jgi:hypothetical protein
MGASAGDEEEASALGGAFDCRAAPGEGLEVAPAPRFQPVGVVWRGRVPAIAAGKTEEEAVPIAHIGDVADAGTDDRAGLVALHGVQVRVEGEGAAVERKGPRLKSRPMEGRAKGVRLRARAEAAPRPPARLVRVWAFSSLAGAGRWSAPTRPVKRSGQASSCASDEDSSR